MKPKNVVLALSALAQETRLAAFRLLVQQGPTGMAAGEIASAVNVSPAALSFHLKEMTHAGLVKSRQEGRFIFYSANFSTMNARRVPDRELLRGRLRCGCLCPRGRLRAGAYPQAGDKA